MRFIFTLFFSAISLFTLGQSATWIHTFGLNASKTIDAMTTDSDGNVYTVGYFSGTIDFDPSVNEHSLTASSTYNSYLLKLDENGNFIYVRQFTGDGLLAPKSIKINSQGQIILAGILTGTVNFNPLTFGTPVTATFIDSFICSLNDDGSLNWIRSFGNTYECRAYDMTVDANDNVFIVASFYNNLNMNDIAGPEISTEFGPNAFIAKYHSNGDFEYVKKIDSVNLANAKCLAADSEGNVYVGGSFSSDLDFEGLTLNCLNDGELDGYVIKLNSTGLPVWGKSFVGDGLDEIVKITCNANGDVFFAGRIFGTIDLDPESTEEMYTTNVENTAVWKYSSEGQLLFADGLNCNASFGVGTRPFAIAMNNNGECFITGDFSETITFGSATLMYNFSGYDAYLLKYNSDGTPGWTGLIRGDMANAGTAIALHPSNDLFLGCSIGGTLDINPFEPNQQITMSAVMNTAVMRLSNSTINIEETTPFSFNAYPNPCSTSIELNWHNQPKSIQIINSIGVEVMTIEHPQKRIELSNLSNGQYMLMLNFDDHFETKTILKQ
jgi:hypothetical protein